MFSLLTVQSTKGLLPEAAALCCAGNITSLQAALVGSLGTLGADLLQVSQNCSLKALDLGQILIPHLGVGQNGVHQLCSGVVLVCVVEVQSPCVILDLVGVAGGAFSAQIGVGIPIIVCTPRLSS